MTIDPRIRIFAGIVMALISYFVAVDNFVAGDVQTGIILTVIGIFFSARVVQNVRRDRTQNVG